MHFRFFSSEFLKSETGSRCDVMLKGMKEGRGLWGWLASFFVIKMALISWDGETSLVEMDGKDLMRFPISPNVHFMSPCGE